MRPSTTAVLLWVLAAQVIIIATAHDIPSP